MSGTNLQEKTDAFRTLHSLFETSHSDNLYYGGYMNWVKPLQKRRMNLQRDGENRLVTMRSASQGYSFDFWQGRVTEKARADAIKKEACTKRRPTRGGMRKGKTKIQKKDQIDSDLVFAPVESSTPKRDKVLKNRAALTWRMDAGK
jgi:hypothetical protein